MILVEQEEAERHRAAGHWGNMALDELLARNARESGEKVALIDHGERIGWRRPFSAELTWSSVDRMVSALAAVFLDCGIKQNDVAVVQLGNSTEALIAHLAMLRAGAIPAAVPVAWRIRDLSAAFSRIDPVVLVTATRIGPTFHCEQMMQSAVETLSVRNVLAFGDPVPDGVQPLNPALAPDAPAEGGKGAPRAGNAADHVAMVTFSSWEGRLEPVARSHNQWIASAMEIALAAEIEPDSSLVTTLLPSSLAGFAAGMVVWLLTGCRLTLVMPMTTSAFQREVTRTTPSHLVVPGSLGSLVNLDEGAENPCCIRYWPAPEVFAQSRDANPTDDEAEATDDGRAIDVVSLDEMALKAIPARTMPSGVMPSGDSDEAPVVLPVAAVAGPGDDPVPEAETPLVSARMPGALFRPGGATVPGALMSGALLVGGPQVPTQPFAPGDGEISFRFKPHPDGFRESGLRCRLTNDAEPMLAVQGHRRDTIITGGLAICAETLDAIYGGYDGFLDAAATSVADDLFGARIVAAVVPRPGGDYSLSAFRAYLRDIGTATHMMPDRIITVPEIPRAPDGTVQRSMISVEPAD